MNLTLLKNIGEYQEAVDLRDSLKGDETTTFYGVLWDNFYGRGEIKPIEIDRVIFDCYIHGDEFVGLDKYWGVYSTYREADARLDFLIQD